MCALAFILLSWKLGGLDQQVDSLAMVDFISKAAVFNTDTT